VFADSVPVLEPVYVGIDLGQVNVAGQVLNEDRIVAKKRRGDNSNQKSQGNGMRVNAPPKEPLLEPCG
jgi:hypothetical protein